MRTLLAILLVSAACSKSSSEPAAGSARPAAPPARTIRVAAASDLTHAFGDLARDFRARTGIAVELELGASGLLARQIEQGAPFAVFAAANRDFVDQVVKAGRCDGATARSYAQGRLVVWTPQTVVSPSKLDELSDARFRRIAIANPEHAPHGKAAREALEKSGLWPKIEDRIVLSEDVQAAMLAARNGSADAALVALSLTISADSGASLRVDPALHAPLDQAMVVCGKPEDADAGKQFADFVTSNDGRALMSSYGYTPPAAPPPK